MCVCVCVCVCVFIRSSRSGVIEKLEALELENVEKMEVEEAVAEVEHSGARQGRSEHRRFHRQVHLCVCVELVDSSNIDRDYDLGFLRS